MRDKWTVMDQFSYLEIYKLIYFANMINKNFC
jgi:hypothetical protein